MDSTSTSLCLTSLCHYCDAGCSSVSSNHCFMIASFQERIGSKLAVWASYLGSTCPCVFKVDKLSWSPSLWTSYHFKAWQIGATWHCRHYCIVSFGRCLSHWKFVFVRGISTANFLWPQSRVVYWPYTPPYLWNITTTHMQLDFPRINALQMLFLRKA